VIEKREAPGGQPGASEATRTERDEAFLSCPPHYSGPVVVCQIDLLELIEQARSRAEADRLRACFYARRARKHWQIKAALEAVL